MFSFNNKIKPGLINNAFPHIDSLIYFNIGAKFSEYLTIIYFFIWIFFYLILFLYPEMKTMIKFHFLDH